MNQGSVSAFVVPQSREVSRSALYPISPGQLSVLRRNEGCHVVYHQQRYWMEAPRGFYQPIHWMARHGIEQAVAPRRWAWGFRTSLNEEAAATQSNGSVPVHLLADLSTYTFDNFSSGRRYHLRRSRKRAVIVELLGPALLHAEGFAVMQSAQGRTGYGETGSREDYDAMIEKHVDPLRRLVLAGMVNGRLGGYLGGTACGETAYID
ncbi:MAG: hypothetical protein JWL90_1032, partial [Chthoniobacteraceae bacterium]|nr:hypothetical protein [Chthoniobacteraceae bacterium]